MDFLGIFFRKFGYIKLPVIIFRPLTKQFPIDSQNPFPPIILLLIPDGLDLLNNTGVVNGGKPLDQFQFCFL